MVPFSPVRLSSLRQILSSLSSFRSCAPLRADAARNWWSTAVAERGWGEEGGEGVQVAAAAEVVVSGLCALPRKKKKSKPTQEERECEGGWGRTGDSEGGMGTQGERGDPVPEAPPESRERKNDLPINTHMLQTV